MSKKPFLPGRMFDGLQRQEYTGSWRPEAPPELHSVSELELDCETDGLRWWAGNKPIGFSICLPDGKTQYIPWGHRGGGNLDEAVVKRWAKEQLRGKRITNLNTKFDIHMLREWGVDLEAQGCEVSDVGHYAALLDDFRVSFSLETISQDWLGIGKLTDVDKTRMAEYHAGEVAAYACRDVELVRMLRLKMWPELTKQDLHRVRALEDQVIFVVCEMEKNGLPIDLELLERWQKEAQQAYLRCLWQIHRETGLKFEPTTSNWVKLFEHFKIPIIEYTEPSAAHPSGQPSFTNEVLKAIENPTIQTARRAARLKSLKAKYIDKYPKVISSDGILRFNLNQLKTTKDEAAGGKEMGTVTGRFSSTAIYDDPPEGDNAQQVFKREKQRILFGYDEDDGTHDDEIFIVRNLMVPRSEPLVDGWKVKWLSADANQIEYRLFAGIARNPEILRAYQENPNLKFHNKIQDMLKPFKPDLAYRQTKDMNFMKIYGGGMAKLAYMMGFISKGKFEELKRQYPKGVPYNHPLLVEAVKIDRIYKEQIPEAGNLNKKYSEIARTKGYVCSILGRRQRFPDKRRLHKALNSVIQPSGADINKIKLVEVHRERLYTGLLLRVTVHDELDGDARRPETEERIREILNRQSVKTSVPITWDVATGNNWAECA